MKTEFTVVGVMENDSIVIVSTKGSMIVLGSLCRVYSKSDELFDPDTGESLGYAELFKGSGIVIKCDDKKAYIQCVKIKMFNPLFKSAVDFPSLLGRPILTEVPWNDMYVIDERKYAKSAFLSPQKGDKVSIN